MSEYAFVTSWLLDASLATVWDAIYQIDQWPEWWPYIEQVVELAPGQANGVDSVRRYTWRTRLPYRLTFTMRTTRVEHEALLEGVASGDLEGSGRWTLQNQGANTLVVYEWRVRTHKPWMNLLAPLLRPLFAWNHDAVMRAGGEGLARRLHCRLISQRGETIS